MTQVSIEDPMENSVYMDSICGERSLLLTEEESLAGQTLISIETTDNVEWGILVYIQDHLPSFLACLRHLAPKDQEILLAYYFCGASQSLLAQIFSSTQTGCSFHIRIAVRTLAALLMFGGKNPNIDQLREILTEANLEEVFLLANGSRDQRVSLSLSQLLTEYMECRSFAVLGERHNVHRPDIRRVMSRVGGQLRSHKNPKQEALGAWIFSLIDKANPTGSGYSSRQVKKCVNKMIENNGILGNFRVPVDSSDFKFLFAPKANFKGHQRCTDMEH